MEKEIENEYDIISLFSESSNESSNETTLSIDESHLIAPRNTNLFMGNIENVSKKNGKNIIYKKDCVISVITGLWVLTVYKILTSTS
jgi:hypothetical protein